MGYHPPAYVSISTLARELDFSETTVREMVKRGDLPKPTRRLGVQDRWKWSDVEAWMDGRESKPEERPSDPIMEAARA